LLTTAFIDDTPSRVDPLSDVGLNGLGQHPLSAFARAFAEHLPSGNDWQHNRGTAIFTHSGVLREVDGGVEQATFNPKHAALHKQHSSTRIDNSSLRWQTEHCPLTKQRR
jgi:hypothetical protein